MKLFVLMTVLLFVYGVLGLGAKRFSKCLRLLYLSLCFHAKILSAAPAREGADSALIVRGARSTAIGGGCDVRGFGALSAPRLGPHPLSLFVTLDSVPRSIPPFSNGTAFNGT